MARRRRGEAMNDPTKLDVCPACGQAAVYVRALDLYMHEDGSSNRLCHLRISRGEVVWQVIDSAGTWAWVERSDGTPITPIDRHGACDCEPPEIREISSELWRRIKEGEVRVIPNGDGWAVALVIDGTYFVGKDDKAFKDEVVNYWRAAELPALIEAVEAK